MYNPMFGPENAAWFRNEASAEATRLVAKAYRFLPQDGEGSSLVRLLESGKWVIVAVDQEGAESIMPLSVAQALLRQLPTDQVATLTALDAGLTGKRAKKTSKSSGVRPSIRPHVKGTGELEATDDAMRAVIQAAMDSMAADPGKGRDV